MTKQIFSNRWFIWAIAVIVITGFGVWGLIEYSAIKMADESAENETISSYLLRQPVQIKPAGSSSCEKSGGKIIGIKECDGSISYACSLPGGQMCYGEDLKDGKCTAGFSPKVLCDKMD